VSRIVIIHPLALLFYHLHGELFRRLRRDSVFWVWFTPHYLFLASSPFPKSFFLDSAELLLTQGARVFYCSPLLDALDAKYVCAAVYFTLAVNYVISANVACQLARLLLGSVHAAKLIAIT
jgi:hypothetical protein